MANLSNIIFDMSHVDVQDLLLVSDLLITDYSSIAADYSLLQRPIIYFCYDYQKYQELVGLYLDLKLDNPNNFAATEDELCRLINSPELLQPNDVNYFHDNVDAKSSQRIFEEINSFLQEKCK